MPHPHPSPVTDVNKSSWREAYSLITWPTDQILESYRHGFPLWKNGRCILRVKCFFTIQGISCAFFQIPTSPKSISTKNSVYWKVVCTTLHKKCLAGKMTSNKNSNLVTLSVLFVSSIVLSILHMSNDLLLSIVLWNKYYFYLYVYRWGNWDPLKFSTSHNWKVTVRIWT